MNRHAVRSASPGPEGNRLCRGPERVGRVSTMICTRSCSSIAASAAISLGVSSEVPAMRSKVSSPSASLRPRPARPRSATAPCAWHALVNAGAVPDFGTADLRAFIAEAFPRRARTRSSPERKMSKRAPPKRGRNSPTPRAPSSLARRMRRPRRPRSSFRPSATTSCVMRRSSASCSPTTA
jgi:hypothetical protein